MKSVEKKNSRVPDMSDQPVDPSDRQRVIAELMETYPDMGRVFRETDRRHYLMMDSSQDAAPALRRSHSCSFDSMSKLKIYPDLTASSAWSFSRNSRGLLVERRSVFPGPGFYEPRKPFLSSAKYSFSKTYRPLSDPSISAGRFAVKTDRGRLSPGPVYPKYTSFPIVHRLMSLSSSCVPLQQHLHT